MVANANTVRLTVVRGEKLRAMDKAKAKGQLGTSDPYAKLTVGWQTPLRTQVVRRTVDPTWDRNFEVIPADTDEATRAIAKWDVPMRLVVTDSDSGSLTAGSDDYMGEAVVPSLAEFLHRPGQERELRLALTNKKKETLEVWRNPVTGEQEAVENSRGWVVVCMRWLHPRESMTYAKLKRVAMDAHATAVARAKAHKVAIELASTKEAEAACLAALQAATEASSDAGYFGAEAENWYKKSSQTRENAEKRELQRQQEEERQRLQRVLQRGGDVNARSPAQRRETLKQQAVIALRILVKMSEVEDSKTAAVMFEQGVSGPLLELLNGKHDERRKLAMSALQSLWKAKMRIVPREIKAGLREPKLLGFKS